MTTATIENLAMQRRLLGVTQAHLATAAGVSEKTIKRAEAGHQMSAETRMAINSVLDALSVPLRGNHGLNDGRRRYVGPILSLSRRSRRNVIAAHLILLPVALLFGVCASLLGVNTAAWPLSLSAIGYVITLILFQLVRLPFGAALSSMLAFLVALLLSYVAMTNLRDAQWVFTSTEGVLVAQCAVYAGFAVYFLRTMQNGIIAFKSNDLGQGLRYRH